MKSIFFRGGAHRRCASFRDPSSTLVMVCISCSTFKLPDFMRKFPLTVTCDFGGECEIVRDRSFLKSASIMRKRRSRRCEPSDVLDGLPLGASELPMRTMAWQWGNECTRFGIECVCKGSSRQPGELPVRGHGCIALRHAVKTPGEPSNKGETTLQILQRLREPEAPHIVYPP
jgi:hypothetical protein